MKNLFILLCLSAQCALLSAQSLLPDSILAHTTRQCSLFPQEKVYIHTDRASYISGENIWMRAHVVDGITNTPSQGSRYVYVVLQNPFMETVTRVQLRADEKGYIYGNISLPSELPKGEYTLYAYTRYMQNAGEAYFFRKKIFITNLLSKSIRMMTEMHGSNLFVRFVHPETGAKQTITNCAAKLPSGYIDVQKEEDGFVIKIFGRKERNLLIQAGNFKEFVNIATKSDYQVDFLPEGGNLIAGTLCKMAFKALNEMGEGEYVEGTIRNEKDSVITSFHTSHRGMGLVAFIPEAGAKYHAVCEDGRGRSKTFPMLQPTSDAYALQINRKKEKIYIHVLHSGETEADDSLFVLAHQRGCPKMLAKWDAKTPYLMVTSKEFEAGIIHFVLADYKGRIRSERLAFNLKETIQGEVEQNATNYESREKMLLQLQLKDPLGNPWNGNCSVSITDNTDVKPDSSISLPAALLLCADLKGYIEAPAWYFEKEDTNTRLQALDVLMMTQGWRRYDLQQVWQGNYQTPKFLPETSQTIEGRVYKRITRLPVKKATVRLMAPVVGLSAEKTVDANGRFHFDGFEYPDSTAYWVSAYSPKGKDNVVVETNKVVEPTLTRNIPPFQLENQLNGSSYVPQQYLEKADNKMIYEKGIRHIFLDEVIVTAPKKIYKTEYEKIMGAQTFKEEEISKSGAGSIGMLLKQKVAGISSVTNKNGTFTIRDEPVLFILDEVMLNTADAPSADKNGADKSSTDKVAFESIFRGLLPQDIEQIDVIKGPQCIGFHSKFSNIIAITTKRGGEKWNDKYPVTNLESIMPLGYQQPVAFYSPRYETNADKESRTPDLRTTIAWQPCLNVMNGRATIECYTADSPAHYTLVVEGVGKDGTVLSMKQTVGNRE